jgi:hypothetical protein
MNHLWVIEFKFKFIKSTWKPYFYNSELCAYATKEEARLVLRKYKMYNPYFYRIVKYVGQE